MRHSEQRRSQRRILRLESLEERRLLVVGTLTNPQPDTYQNPGNPEDANGDGAISPVDALSVINVLNQATGEETASPNMNDVNGDGEITPLDALLIINRINNRAPSSTIPPELRAQRLREALESENLPPQIKPEEAQEILATLEHGGRWELGDRYRDGKLINIHNTPEADAEPQGQVTEGPSVSESADDALPFTTEMEPLADGADLPAELNEAMSPAWLDNVPSTLIRDTITAVRDRVCEQAAATTEEVIDGLEETYRHLSEKLDEALGELEQPDWTSVTEQLLADWPESAPPLDDLVADLQDSLTAQSVRDDIYRALSNLDIPLIVEQLRVDAGTLVELACIRGSDQPQPLAQLLAGDALTIV